MTALSLAYAEEAYDLQRRIEAIRDCGQAPVSEDAALRHDLDLTLALIKRVIDRFEEHANGWAG